MKNTSSFRTVRSLGAAASALAALAFFLSGCSNWALIERCEKTNWFDYAQGVSFQGKYLEEDDFVRDCRGVDRFNSVQTDLGFKLGREKICTYDEIFRRGKAGTPVFFKFCDGLDQSTMIRRHADGLTLFCVRDVGYAYGKSGQVYQKVCPANQERDFLPAYHEGRKLYLTDRRAQLKAQIATTENQLSAATTRESRASADYQSVPHPQECRTLQVYSEEVKRDLPRLVCSEAPYALLQRNTFFDQLSAIRHEVNSLGAQLVRLRDDWNGNELELTKIPLPN